MGIQLTLEQRSDIAYHISFSYPKSNEARKIMAKKYYLTKDEINSMNEQYWQRWHQLLDIKIERQFNSDEAKEYRQMLKVVRRLDKEEDEQTNRLIAKSEEQLRKTKNHLNL